MRPPPRFDVTAEQIDEVVAYFYARIRAEPTLGPVFADKVEDWPAHEAKIAAFWRNAILHERDYSGNPMRVHMQAGNVKAGHFEVWLELFDTVLAEQLPAKIATGWSALAHRIGAGLRFGLTADTAGGVPNLR
ncbi:hemoglobin [Octadecabacter temperatus]|uniref:Group 3 truncated hemoglobin ctb n=1 Tax=Octadecabacter temperatus TaxID=1458307 RepID=A0A0K0Y792_9RHOB|nr:group III truncated hemoglobin [Octadecabacter temperatus]AKS46727.1 Group 3 truncated hemoglobin ctb [Octadecabacter temperatus]SIO20086.1 hemoglobin [Octadecabacter temperatus]